MRPTADKKEHHFPVSHVSALGVQLWISCKARQRVQCYYSILLFSITRRFTTTQAYRLWLEHCDEL